MTKTKSKFVCQECGYEIIKWMGKCPECCSWNTFEEIKFNKIHNKRIGNAKKISEIEEKEFKRYVTKIKEFDRVLGGGVTRGSLTLIGGEPGIGKSTLLMEVCGQLSNLYSDYNILYVSGEESETQVASRCKRLGITKENFYILNETNWQSIVETIKNIKPKFFVLDSIQTTVSSEIQSIAGNISQVKEVTFELMNLAKKTDMTCFVVGHVTKGGTFAGPKVLEHMVDTAIHFEGDQFKQNRILRVMKNRFGNTDELGLFEMTDKGLKEITAPLSHFVDNINKDSFGRTITCILEGNRPLFVEIQALVAENKFSSGKKTTQGIDHNRLSLLVAVVDKYFELPLSINDIYVNVVGGIRLDSRESDLSIIASLLSSFYTEPISEQVVFLGEVGLTGEVRPVARIENRLRELEQLQYKGVILSTTNRDELSEDYNLQILGISNANELKDLLFSEKSNNIRQ